MRMTESISSHLEQRNITLFLIIKRSLDFLSGVNVYNMKDQRERYPFDESYLFLLTPVSLLHITLENNKKKLIMQQCFVLQYFASKRHSCASPFAKLSL